jgi:hypothetical protein
VQQMEQSFFKSVVETVGPMFAPGSKIIILRFQMILKQLIRSTDTKHMLIGDRNNKNGDTGTTDTSIKYTTYKYHYNSPYQMGNYKRASK